MSVINKKNSGYLLILLAAGIIIFQYVRYYIAPKVQFKTLTLTDMDGNEVKLIPEKGKTMVVTFFATWCGSCHQEFSLIEQLKMQNKLNNFQFVAISDESIDKLKAFAKYNYSHSKVLHSAHLVNSVGVYSFPTNYIISNSGKLIYSAVGTIDWNNNNLISTFH